MKIIDEREMKKKAKQKTKKQIQKKQAATDTIVKR